MSRQLKIGYETLCFSLLMLSLYSYVSTVDMEGSSWYWFDLIEAIVVDGSFIFFAYLALKHVIGRYISPKKNALLTSALLATYTLIVYASYSLYSINGSRLTLDLTIYGIKQGGGMVRVVTDSASNHVVTDFWIFICLLLGALAYRLSNVFRGWALAATLISVPLVLLHAPGLLRNSDWSWSNDWFQQSYAARFFVIKQEDNAFADLLTNTAEIPKWNFSKSLAHAIPNQKKPNIIILVMESVRSDAITQENMPFIAAMTQRSDQFLQAYTTKDHTSKALIGIFCGMYSKDDLAVSEDSNNNPLNCLPKYLGSNNYRVGYFQSADEKFEDRPRLLKLMGFSDWKALKDLDNSRFKYLGYFGIDDHAMLNPIQKWISQNPAGQPFFLGVLNVGTHHPYDLPGKKNPYPDDAQRSKEAYLETLRLYDDFVAKLVFWLEKKGILGNTMLVLTGDHGEAFQEHGLSTHGHVPYQEVARIPLIVHRPGQTIGRIDNQLRQHIDILPTVLSEAGYTPPAKVPGKVLYGPGHDQLYFSCWTRSDCIALIEPNRKYIYHFGKTSFEVFNSGMDPLEQNNIAEKIDNKTKKKALSTMLTYRRAISNFYSKEN